MSISAPALVCAARPHGETGVIVRLLTESAGLAAAYVPGGRGRALRPVLIPGNLVAVEWKQAPAARLPSARLELVTSRGPWLTEPLPAAAIAWVTALTAIALPEHHAYPALYMALPALIEAICHAPSARGWAPALLAYERLLLRELGYGDAPADDGTPFAARFARQGATLARYPLADARRDGMGARQRLGELLARIDGL